MNIPHIPIGILGLTALAIIVWYVAEWMRCKDERQSMALVRNPLALFRLAVERLWYNRRLVAILMAIWLGSTVLWRLVIEPVFYAELLTQRKAVEATFGLGGLSALEPLRAQAVAELCQQLWQALPGIHGISLGYGGGSWLATPIALALLAGVLIRLWYCPPAWLPVGTRTRLVWPIHLSLVGFLLWSAGRSVPLFNWQLQVSGAQLAWGLRALESTSVVLFPFVGAVLATLLYDVTLQVGSGKYWDLRRALLAAVDNWLPIAWLSLILALPFAVMPFSEGGAVEGSFRFWFLKYVSQSFFRLPTLLACALLFVPWIVLAEKAGFGDAVDRNFQLICNRWADLLAFAVRYLLVVAPIFTLLGVFKHLTRGHSTADDLILLAGYLLVLLLAVTTAVLYHELRKEKTADSKDALAGVGD